MMNMTAGAILRADRAAARLFTTAAAVLAAANPEHERAARIRRAAGEHRRLFTPAGGTRLDPK